jgi:hypothetical protein
MTTVQLSDGSFGGARRVSMWSRMMSVLWERGKSERERERETERERK